MPFYGHKDYKRLVTKMTFRATNLSANVAYAELKNVIRRLKTSAASRATEFQSTTSSLNVVAMLDDLARQRVRVTALKDVPGLTEEAIRQESDALYNAKTEAEQVLSDLDAVVADVTARFPVDGSGYLLIYKFNADGTVDPRTFTPAQLAPTRTLLLALDSNIT